MMCVSLSTLQVFRPRVPSDALALVAAVLDYVPTNRLTAFRVLAHEFFDELRVPSTTYEGLFRACIMSLHSLVTSGRPLPPLFDFSAAGSLL